MTALALMPLLGAQPQASTECLNPYSDRQKIEGVAVGDQQGLAAIARSACGLTPSVVETPVSDSNGQGSTPAIPLFSSFFLPRRLRLGYSASAEGAEVGHKRRSEGQPPPSSRGQGNRWSAWLRLVFDPGVFSQRNPAIEVTHTENSFHPPALEALTGNPFLSSESSVLGTSPVFPQPLSSERTLP